MKRMLAICLVLTLAFSFAACGSKTTTPKDYAQIIETTREADYNEAFSIVSGKQGEDPVLALNALGISEAETAGAIDMVLQVLGIDATQMEQYAVSASIMITNTYTTGIFKPVKGQEQAVKDSLNAYVTQQQKNFEQYLPDQYEITKKAVLEQVPTGEIILVMSENAQSVADSIKQALK